MTALPPPLPNEEEGRRGGIAVNPILCVPPSLSLSVRSWPPPRFLRADVITLLRRKGERESGGGGGGGGGEMKGVTAEMNAAQCGGIGFAEGAALSLPLSLQIACNAVRD